MKRVCAVVLLSFGVAASAAAQRTTGEIIGKVVDESGSVLPGVTVTLRGAGVAGAPTVVTSETGVYRFPVLPPGTYERRIRARRASARSSATAIPVAVGAVVELDVTLKVGALEESVTVSGASPVVDLASSEVSTAYNREWVRERAGPALLVLRSDQLGARRQRDVERRPEHGGAVARQQHQRELLPDRRHRHQLDAVAEHRRHRGSRSAAARRLGRIRQRPGRGLQHRHAPGRQRVPRRRQRLLPERRR